jgi:hypothetical protein
MIGNESTIDMDINKTTFYQSVDIAGEFVDVNSFKASRIDVSDKIVISGQQPTLYLKDTNQRSGMIHMNSDKMYFLSGRTNTESWSQVVVGGLLFYIQIIIMPNSVATCFHLDK